VKVGGPFYPCSLCFPFVAACFPSAVSDFLFVGFAEFSAAVVGAVAELAVLSSAARQADARSGCGSPEGGLHSGYSAVDSPRGDLHSDCSVAGLRSVDSRLVGSDYSVAYLGAGSHSAGLD
jgi:hypothetical protein